MSPELGMAKFRPEREGFRAGMSELISSDGAHPLECPTGGVGAGGGFDWSVDRATYDLERIQVPPRGPLPHHPQVSNEASLRDLAMHPVWCGCRGRLASPLLGGIATAVAKAAQRSLRYNPCQSASPRVATSQPAHGARPVPVATRAGGAASLSTDTLSDTLCRGQVRTPADERAR